MTLQWLAHHASQLAWIAVYLAAFSFVLAALVQWGRWIWQRRRLLQFKMRGRTAYDAWDARRQASAASERDAFRDHIQARLAARLEQHDADAKAFQEAEDRRKARVIHRWPPKDGDAA